MPTFPNATGQTWQVLNATGLRQNTFEATRPPINTDDFSLGWEVGSVWLYDNVQWVCLHNAIGAAVWQMNMTGESTYEVWLETHPGGTKEEYLADMSVDPSPEMQAMLDDAQTAAGDAQAAETAASASAAQADAAADAAAGAVVEGAAALRNDIDPERDTGQTPEKRVISAVGSVALIAMSGEENAELDLKLSPLSAQIAARAGSDDRGLVSGRLPLTVAGAAVIESMDRFGAVRWDNPFVDPERHLCRGAYIKTVSNGFVTETVTPEGALRTPGAAGEADSEGRYNFFTSPGGYSGYTKAGSVYHVRSGVTIKVPRSGKVELFLSTGQSWIAQNGQNGRLARFATPLRPNTVLMPNDADGTTVPAGFTPDMITFIEPYYEKKGGYQSVMGPIGLSLDALRQNSGRDGAFVMRGVATDGTQLSVLSSPETYAKFIATATQIKQYVESFGLELTVSAIFFEHGAADSSMPYADYKAAMSSYLDDMAEDMKALTGQPYLPKRIIGQPPGFDTSGAWPCLKSQVDICHERPDDYILSGSGWAYPQRDFTHYTNESCVARGGQHADCADIVLSGGQWNVPYIYAPYRDGVTIYCPIEGGLDVYAVPDAEIPHTERHGEIAADGTTWTRIPNEGFEFIPTSGSASIVSVDVQPRMVVITLSEDAAGQLRHAWHQGADRRHRTNGDGSPYRMNESANRGTIKARRAVPVFYGTQPVGLWLASGYWDL